MDEGVPARAAWPDVVGVVAAASIGVLFAVRGLPLALISAVDDLVPDPSLARAAYAAALLTVAVAVPGLLSRVSGWLVAAVGLLVVLVGDLVVADATVTLLPERSRPVSELVVVFAVSAGVGLALGGSLLAVAQTPRSTRWWLGAGLVGGLVLHPVSSALFRAFLPEPAPYGPVPTARTLQPADLQLWIAVAATVVAAAVTFRRASGVPAVPARPRVGALVAVTGATVLLTVGLAVRLRIVDGFRYSPDGLAGPRRERAVEPFAHFSAVALAVVVALLLAAYAYRAGRARAARWVVLCAAAGPIMVIGFRLDVISPTPGSALVLVFGLVAVVGGALVGRHAEDLAPWDAVGLVVAAVATPLTSAVVRAEFPSVRTVGPVLIVVGLGLALGYGIVQAVLPGVDRPAGDAGVFVLGPAALVLTATALAPVVVRLEYDGPSQGPSFTVPVFAAVGALLLVLLFGFAWCPPSSPRPHRGGGRTRRAVGRARRAAHHVPV
ncbi:hypothetical protein [Micromonospora sp. NPDC049497]|uniref:hypothetical protein n=1 Tax=Micromonospora sp. NPDC049497 TaxID=3364273 RepID=UPI0037B67D55